MKIDQSFCQDYRILTIIIVLMFRARLSRSLIPVLYNLSQIRERCMNFLMSDLHEHFFHVKTVSCLLIIYDVILICWSALHIGQCHRS